MDTKRLLAGTVVGGVVMYLMGLLLWAMLFASVRWLPTSFFEGLMATEAGRSGAILWADIVGTATLAMLLTLVIGWTGSSTIVEGLKTGALVNFMVWLGVDLILYANLTIVELNGIMVDPVLELVRGGVAGAAIALVSRGSGGAEAG